MAAMLAETITPITAIHTNNPKKPIKVFLSYSAYAKNVIQHLKSSSIIVENGLSEFEFSSIESKFNFTFPPDLRSILQEGLPVGHGFPNWRYSSEQQLEIFKNLPILGILKQVKKCNFWLRSWGTTRPNDDDLAVDIAEVELLKYPILVPIYRNFYIPARPCLAGNPVFYVHDGDVKLWSYDICGFFQELEFRGNDVVFRRPSLLNLLNAPAWAATEARQIEFWTKMAEDTAASEGDLGRAWWKSQVMVEMGEARGEGGGSTLESDGRRVKDIGVVHGSGRHRRWWSEDLEGYLEEVFLRLTEAGWKEEDVREMMMVDGSDSDDCDGGYGVRRKGSECGALVDKKVVESHVRLLSKRLLRAGWSTEDVVDSLGSTEENEIYTEEDSCIDFYQIQ